MKTLDPALRVAWGLLVGIAWCSFPGPMAQCSGGDLQDEVSLILLERHVGDRKERLESLIEEGGSEVDVEMILFEFASADVVNGEQLAVNHARFAVPLLGYFATADESKALLWQLSTHEHPSWRSRAIRSAVVADGYAQGEAGYAFTDNALQVLTNGEVYSGYDRRCVYESMIKCSKELGEPEEATEKQGIITLLKSRLSPETRIANLIVLDRFLAEHDGSYTRSQLRKSVLNRVREGGLDKHIRYADENDFDPGNV
jgi:hypothetical protein